MRKAFSLVCVALLLAVLIALPGGAAASPVYEVLRIGDSGESVEALQTRLIALGYDVETADGAFGEKTEAAVRQAQLFAGLEATGVADEATQAVIFGIGFAEPFTQSAQEPAGEEADYIANKNTKKFHDPGCSSVDQMKEENKWYFSGSRETLIEAGYDPCKRCNP